MRTSKEQVLHKIYTMRTNTNKFFLGSFNNLLLSKSKEEEEEKSRNFNEYILTSFMNKFSYLTNLINQIHGKICHWIIILNQTFFKLKKKFINITIVSNFLFEWKKHFFEIKIFCYQALEFIFFRRMRGMHHHFRFAWKLVKTWHLLKETQSVTVTNYFCLFCSHATHIMTDFLAW